MGKGKKSRKGRKPFKLLICLAGVIPSTHIRLFSPFRWLVHKKSVDPQIVEESELAPHLVEQADILLFQRNTNPRLVPIFEYAKNAGKKVIYECDDNLLLIPKDMEIIGSYYDQPEVRETFKKLLGLADVVTTTTEFLASSFRSFNASVTVLPNCVDLQLIGAKKEKASNDQVVIGYAGTVTHNSDFIEVWPALKRLWQEYGERIKFEFFGLVPEELKELPNLSHQAYSDDYLGFLQRLNSAGWDLALAPLENKPLNLGKTDNKFREYGACRIPGVYSDMPVYSGSIRQGETGILVSHTSGDWYQGIRSLVEDGELRKKIANKAHWYVREKYSVKKSAKAWLNLFYGLMSDGAPQEWQNGEFA